MDQQIFVQMVLHAWNVNIKRAEKFFDSLTDEELLKEVAPKRNRVNYLLGHLIAINDNMIGLFGLGNRSYAHFDEPFVKNPDRSGLDMPDTTTLKNDWKKSNAELTSYFDKMTPQDWFSKHNAMTEEDHIKEPSRNKLSVLINRTNHVAYHLGQLVLAK